MACAAGGMLAFWCGPSRADGFVPPPMAVTVIQARSGCFVDTLQLSGTIMAREEVQVRPDVEGLHVARILVEDGASVTSGQPLAQLVRPDWLPGSPATATMKASAAGILVHRPLPIGMPASARGEPMFRIIRNGELELQVEVPQNELAKIKVGQTARVQTLGSAELAGTVRVVLPDVDVQTQIGHARIQLRATSGTRPGAFAKASIDTSRTCGAAVPLSAILYGPQGAIVQVVKDDHVETRPVRVGLFSGQDAEIREGLAAGETVIARAGAFLREGEAVRIFPAPETSRQVRP